MWPMRTGVERRAGGAGAPLDAVRIGHIDGDASTPLHLAAPSRDGPDGAILVRPDRFVAWRSPGAADDPARELTTALSASSPAPSTAIPA